MYPTKNSLDAKIRSSSVSLLQNRLSSALDFMLQSKQAHWNVKGAEFISLHEFFDDINDSARDWVDLIAERIMQLGGISEGTLRASADRTQLPEYPLDISEGLDHIEALSRSLAFFGELVRTAIDQCDDLGDADSADIFTQISRGVDKHLWMLESHTQAGTYTELEPSSAA